MADTARSSEIRFNNRPIKKNLPIREPSRSGAGRVLNQCWVTEAPRG